jgi:nitrite reductase (NADH) large subunit
MSTAQISGIRRERLVVVGNGMASLRLLEELTKQAPDRYEITVVGAEPIPAYNRILLSSVLAGELKPAEAELRERAWYAESGIGLITGKPATAIRPNKRDVVLAGGHRLPYDTLVLAIGSAPVRLPIPGAQRRGVHTFRNFADVAAMRGAMPGTPAVVIGGGLLGVEAAYGLVRQGCSVTLIHLMPRLMERQLDAAAAAVLKGALEKLGIRVLLEASTASIDGGIAAEGVTLKDGRHVTTSIVVIAAGVRPNTELAETAGIETSRGIVVDDKLETNWPRVYAIGECAEHRGIVYGLVEPAYEQARSLARYLSGQPSRYTGSLLATNLKVSGVPVFSMGAIEGDDQIIVDDPAAGIYRKIVLEDDRIAGAVLVGDTADALWYRELMAEGAPVGDMRSMLAFGRAFAEAA